LIKEHLKLTCSVIIDDITENWDTYSDGFEVSNFY